MKISCMIIDDEPLARKGMEEYVRETDFLHLVAVCENAVKAYPVIHREDVQLILVDIEMPKLSGIDFLRSLSNPPACIFTTAYPQYALESYELDVVDYLVKPVSFQRFFKAVTKAKDLLTARSSYKPDAGDEAYFFLKVNSKFEKIFYEDVLYVEALQNYVSIQLKQKRVVSYLTISSLEKQLPPALFMRIHKSYIVALNKIDAVEGNIVLIHNLQLPVSRTLKDVLMSRVVDSRLMRRN